MFCIIALYNNMIKPANSKTSYVFIWLLFLKIISLIRRQPPDFRTHGVQWKLVSAPFKGHYMALAR